MTTEPSTIAPSAPEELDLRSADLAALHRSELLRLFPEVGTEDGKIDLDKLRRALGEMVDPGKERYGLVWPGKGDCLTTIQAPSLATLRPQRSESVNFDETSNLIIEGDNLEVLKLLQKSYLGKVKMAYADVPYNTGNDFIYPDDFSESLQTYLEYTGQIDSEGRRFSTNTEADGRFHSKWLNMMYTRMYLARNLLREDGTLFVSIDDHEVARLRLLLDDVFGPDNFLATFVWKRKAGGGDDSEHVAAEHEYVHCYARNAAKCTLQSILHESPSMTAKYNKEEGGRRYYLERLDKTSLTYSASMDFPIESPDASAIHPPQPDPEKPTTIWRWSRTKVAENRGELIFIREAKTDEWRIYTKTWESLDGVTPRSLLVDKEHGRNRDGTQELASLLGPKIFSNPKPLRLIRHLLSIGGKDEDALILDFFAGSGTTGQAVLDMNVHDGGRRRFILIQLPEPTGRDDFPTITDITRARVRKAIQVLDEKGATDLTKVPFEGDRGFRAFELAQSNFEPWDATVAHDAVALSRQLEMHVHHVRADRTSDDLLFEIVLKSGFDLGVPIQTRSIDSRTVFGVDGQALIVCLEPDLTLDLIRAIAAMKAERVVFLDEGFAGNDQLKANAAQLFKTKGTPSFKTI